MIVCVLLVSNSLMLSRRGAITRAAPSWSPGAARQHPREFDNNNTHTVMFDPLNESHQLSITTENIMLIFICDLGDDIAGPYNDF